MPALDFKEIAIATKGASRDQFELLARDFLEHVGYVCVIGPDRGPDAGRDMVFEEVRTGVAGTTTIRWLVSCKHKAHSGAAVSPGDEEDIHDRVKTHGCAGFLAVYSTIPSSGLAAKLNASGKQFETCIYDQEKIEKRLLESPEGMLIARRYFPKSIDVWAKSHSGPANLFTQAVELPCRNCGQDLLKPNRHGIVVVWSRRTLTEESREKHTEHLYWCCKGGCDQALRGAYSKTDLIDAWEDISDLRMPLPYIRWVIASLNELQRGDTYSIAAMNNQKNLLLNLFPFVSREMNEGEKARMTSLSAIPAALGGWGYDG